MSGRPSTLKTVHLACTRAVSRFRAARGSYTARLRLQLAPREEVASTIREYLSRTNIPEERTPQAILKGLKIRTGGHIYGL